MKRALQKLVVGAALRVIHAALVELREMDAYVAEEFAKLPDGISYAIRTGYRCPALYVRRNGDELQRLSTLNTPHCELSLKSLAVSYRLFTGQMGLAQAYAQHAFTLAGDIADVMRLARLVNRAEAYLFPPFITEKILTAHPTLPASPLRLYARLLLGFLTAKYKKT